MKILLHCCQTSYFYFLREAVSRALAENIPVEWSMILYSNANDLSGQLNGLIKEENILSLQKGLNVHMRQGCASLNDLEDFPASVFQCVSTSKVEPGIIHLQRKSRQYQLKLISGTYKIYKDFLLKTRPDFVFLPSIEIYDSAVLYYVCRELGIPAIVYAHARNFGISFLSDSIYETLPPYASRCEICEKDLKRARDFIFSFRENYRAPFLSTQNAANVDDMVTVPYFNRMFLKKISDFVKKRSRLIFMSKTERDDLTEPHCVDKYTVLKTIQVQFFLKLAIKWREMKGRAAGVYCDIRDTDKLPEKFIYYPLQYTPELSINTPAPFFVDQLRAIDLILASMPSDYYLVIKEHPALQGLREWSFYENVKKRSSVLLADLSLPSIEITRKAALTISVTGTACLEALLIGKPSLHIGRAFFSDWIYKFDNFYSFGDLIKEAIGSKEAPMDRIVDLASRVFAAGDDFVIFSPTDPYRKQELVMNRKNIDKFLENLMKHINRTTEFEGKGGAKQ